MTSTSSPSPSSHRSRSSSASAQTPNPGYTPPQYQYGGYVPAAPHTRAVAATSGYAAPGYNRSGSISSVNSNSTGGSSTASNLTTGPANGGGWVRGVEGVGQGVRELSRISGDVPSAVRNLLLSIKELQDSLTQWSVEKMTEVEVSDIYVQFGEDLNSAIHAFAHHRIDLSEALSIPKDLRTVLEQCLSEEPSPATLENFMPHVRHILYQLLVRLKERKEAWKEVVIASGRNAANGHGHAPTHAHGHHAHSHSHAGMQGAANGVVV